MNPIYILLSFMQNTLSDEKQQIKKNVRKKIVKLKIKQAPQERTVSREFTDPIYAGLDDPHEQVQVNHWEPWLNSTIQENIIVQHPKQVRKVRSFPKFKPNVRQKKKLENKQAPKNQIHEASNHPLPLIRERAPSSMKEIHLQTIEINKKIPSLSQLKRKKNKPFSLTRLEWRTPMDSFSRTPPVENNKVKVGRVIYNYCCTNEDECLIDYSKILEKKKVLPMIKSEELKAAKSIKGSYWKMSNEEKINFFEKMKRV